MSIAIMSLLACIVLIVFAIVPKGLMLTEIVFCTLLLQF